jgi:hypothetical protein
VANDFARIADEEIMGAGDFHDSPAFNEPLGGWRDHNTVLRCYIRPDEAALREALDISAERPAVGT